MAHKLWMRGLLAALLGLSLAACQGERGPQGPAGQPGQDGDDGADGDVGPIGPQGPGATLPPGVGLKLEIQSATIAAGTVTVTFKATDAAGLPVDAVAERVNKAVTGFEPRFTLAMIDVNGASQSIYLGSTGSPSSDRAGAIAPTATPGVFTYTFATPVVVADPSATHTVGVWGYRYDAEKLRYPSSDTFAFVPGGGTPVVREIVSDASCNACHGSLTLHGSRQGVALCTTCHTSQLAGGEGEMAYMAHKIHNGHNLVNGYELGGHDYGHVTYPQSIANCAACHKGANADNYKTKLSRAVCGSCHDDVNFATGANHGNGSATMIQVDDSKCTMCHTAASVAASHVPVVKPDEGSSLHVAGGNIRTNAGWMAAAGVVPPGADQLAYVVKSVSRDANKNPVITFKLTRKASGATTATDVVWQDFSAGATELIANFVGTPVAYFAFAVPQDGVEKPADFNVTASVAVKRVWNGTVATSTMTGPDAEGYYTVTIKNAIVPDNATMLTGGLGYAYDLPNNQPLTQTNVPGYPYDDNSDGDNLKTGTGGLIVPIPNVWKVATGYTARRTIVSNEKCNACHAFLGAAPSYHVGQRNDAPTCSFCHTPNRTSSAWSANAKDFVHGIHAAGVRTENYTWHQLSPTEGFWQVTYPRPANNCEACHTAGSYDFSSAAAKAAAPNLLASTVGTGTYAVGSAHSPYVAEGVAYGSGFSYATATGVTTEAAPTTLVVSPVTAACSACHDGELAMAHMAQNGGSFYATRAEAAAETETCLLCHGSGKLADIADMHK